MKAARYILLLFLLPFLLSATKKNTVSNKDILGMTIPDFSLPGIDGKQFSTPKHTGAKGFIVVFSCNHCPFAKLYTSRLNALHSKYSTLGVPLVVINSMDSLLFEQETFPQMKSRARENQYHFPYLQDASQQIAKMFKASKTPQAFVVWKEDNKMLIKYVGAIDNNGEHPEQATPYLANAVDELLSGKPVTIGNTPSLGCSIYIRK